MNCKRCNSTSIKIVNYLGIKCQVCNDCGYDEREAYEVFPEERSSQKAKGSYSPYKTGGPKRTQKR